MNDRMRTVIGVALLIFFVGIGLAGVAGGEMETVYSRAANVCLECIGIN